MKRIVFLPMLIFLGSCTHEIRQAPKSVTANPGLHSGKEDCTRLDSLMLHSWKLADAAHAAHFRFYEKNDSLVNGYLMGKYKQCLIGLPRKSIEAKFGAPTFSDSNNIYYQFLSTDKSRPLCLKFWVVSDTVESIRYQLCEGF